MSMTSMLGRASNVLAVRVRGDGRRRLLRRVYVGLSYLLGEEVADRIGNADITAIVSVFVIVAIGLGIRAGYHRWRATRQAGKPGQSNATSGVP